MKDSFHPTSSSIRPRLTLLPPPRLSWWARLKVWWARRQLWRWKPHGRTGCDYNLFWRLHIVNTPWGNLVLHWIINPDPLSLGMHDHPWYFQSIVLWNGYTEKYLPDWCSATAPWSEDFVHYRFRGIGSYDSHPSTYTHAIVALKNKRPCLTLCWTSKRNRKWGFPEKGITVEGQPDV